MSNAYPPGIDVQILGRVIPFPTGDAALRIRVIYASGSHIEPHTDPGTGVWVVDQGATGFATGGRHRKGLRPPACTPIVPVLFASRTCMSKSPGTR